MGGDVLAGTNFVDALNLFENDPDTRGIILVVPSELYSKNPDKRTKDTITYLGSTVLLR
jgi:succinyl-CoA synthetase alpha subunit